jgi:hypothetical protein
MPAPHFMPKYFSKACFKIRFVSGHDFSRAEKGRKSNGF